MSTPRRPHILHLTFGTELGGTETMILRSLDHADTRSFRFSVAAFMERGPLLERAARRGCTTFLMGMRGERDVVGLVRALPRLYRFMRRENVALTCTYGYYTGLAGRAVARLARARVICGQRTADPRRPWIRSFLNRASSGLVDLYVSNSEAGRRLLIERDRIPAAKVLTIHSGIDPAWGAPAPAALEPTRPGTTSPLSGAHPTVDGAVVGMVAHFRPGKSFDQVVRIGEQIRRSLPEVTFILVGDGETRGEVERLAERTEDRSAFIFAGALDDIAPLLSSLDLFVLATETEGLPVSIIEAMAMARPVIATNVGGIPEIVEHDVTGLLVPPGDDGALAVAIRRLLADPELAGRMGEAGQRRIRERFDVKTMVVRLEATYRRVLAFCEARLHE
jgi:glycosyltransferase involved in cell wall biosynthesis